MKPRWTKDPKFRWIGLNDLVAVAIVVANLFLLFQAATGGLDAALGTIIITANMAGFGIVMYWLFGPQAAEGGADVIGVGNEGSDTPPGEEPATADRAASGDGATAPERSGAQPPHEEGA